MVHGKEWCVSLFLKVDISNLSDGFVGGEFEFCSDEHKLQVKFREKKGCVDLAVLLSMKSATGDFRVTPGAQDR